MPVIAVRTHHDDLLGLVAPFAVAASHRTALVVDLASSGFAFPGSKSLADLVRDGPTLAELSPQRTGVVSLPNGGIGGDDADEVMRALSRGWPAVVIRQSEPLGFGPQADVVPALPGIERPGPCIWVKAGHDTSDLIGPTVVGPPRASIHAAMAGSQLRGRWLRSWATVWEWPWR